MQSGFFTAAQGVDIFLLVGGRKQESGQELHGCIAHAVVDHDVFRYFGYGVYDTLVFVKRDSLLAVISEPYGLAYVPFAGILWHYALEHLDEGGFAHAVMAYYAKTLVAGECVAEVVKNHLVAVTLVDSCCFEYL